MKVVLEFTYDADIVSIPVENTADLKKLQNKFDKWIHSTDSNHPFWDYSSGSKVACYRGDAFVYWLNEFIFKESTEKAEFLESEINDYDKSLPSLWF